MLTLLNEREFDNGDKRVKTPLVSVIAASNELPDDEGLEALYDRFLCRYQVTPVSTQQFTALLEIQDDSLTIDNQQPFSAQDLSEIQQQASRVKLPEEVINFLHSLRDFLQQENIYVSDRRWRKLIKFLKVAAYTNGQDTINLWDCYLLQHCLWHKPEQRQLITHWYQSQMGISGQLNLKTLEKLVQTWEQVFEQDQNSEIQQVNENNQLLYKNRTGKLVTNKTTQTPFTREGTPLFLAPAGQEDRTNNGHGYTKTELKQKFFDDLYQQTHINGQWVHLDSYINNPEHHYIESYNNTPVMDSKRHSSAFIDGRVKEILNLAKDIGQLQHELKKQLSSLDKVISEHLWLLPEFTQLTSTSITSVLKQTNNLLTRLESVMHNYQKLPQL